MTTKEPAVRARLSPSNEALFETVEEYLLWAAQIAPFPQFDRLYKQTGQKGLSVKVFREARSKENRRKVEAVMKKTPCTDGSTLFEAMQRQLNQKPR